MKRILVTGADGYCGWPVVLKLLETTDYEIIGIDSCYRRSWVKLVGGDTLLPIVSYRERSDFLRRTYGDRVKLLEYDLTLTPVVESILRRYQPDVILHLASQPSAPFSQKDSWFCNFTQANNLQMTLNLIWAIRDIKPETKLVVTTTTGIYGAPDFPIPEGGIVINEKEIPFPSMGGSFYHMSRAFDSSNLWLAHRWFNVQVIELRTSIVCGSSTVETRKEKKLNTRFDYDPYFGVVVNRFVAQAVSGKPLTIYGKGLQKKPMISLEDMVRTTIRSIEIDTDYKIFNQTQDVISIVEIAETVKRVLQENFDLDVKIEHIPNPRVEDEEHQMSMDNSSFFSLLAGGSWQCTLLEAIKQSCLDIYPYRHRITNGG